MGMFDNMSPDVMALLSAGGAMATPPTRIPVPFSYSLSQGLSAIPQGVQAANQLKQQGQQTQMSQMALDRQKLLQAPQIAAMLGSLPGSQPNGTSATSGGSGSGATGNTMSAPMGVPAGYDTLRDQMINAGRLKFGMTGDPTELEKAYQSAYENDPMLAGRKTGQQEGAKLFMQPNGTYALGSSMGAGGNPGMPTSAPLSPGAMPPPPQMVNGKPQAPQNMDDLLNQQSAQPNVIPNPIPGTTPGVPAAPPKVPMALDGKPLIPGMTNLFKPDPTGTPNFGPVKTKQDADLVTQNQKELGDGDKEFTTLANSFNNEGTRLNNLIDLFKQTQSGTAMAQFPELVSKAVAMGIVKDPATIKNLSDLQTANQNFILDVIGQIKDTNANVGGGAAARTFGSEISELLENGQSVKNQPQALWNVISQAKGLVDQHTDMLNGWNTVGGRGNRIAAGQTMLPDTYAQKFLLAHPTQPYIQNAQQTMGPFKGMANAKGVPMQQTIHFNDLPD